MKTEWSKEFFNCSGPSVSELFPFSKTLHKGEFQKIGQFDDHGIRSEICSKLTINVPVAGSVISKGGQKGFLALAICTSRMG